MTRSAYAALAHDRLRTVTSLIYAYEETLAPEIDPAQQEAAALRLLLACERLRADLTLGLSRPVLAADEFVWALTNALERAALSSDGTVSRYDLRSTDDERGLTLMPICDWSQPTANTFGYCGLSFAFTRDEMLYRLYPAYLRNLCGYACCQGGCGDPTTRRDPDGTPMCAACCAEVQIGA